MTEGHWRVEEGGVWTGTLLHLVRHTSESRLLRTFLAMSNPGSPSSRTEGRGRPRGKLGKLRQQGERNFPEADLCIWLMTKQSAACLCLQHQQQTGDRSHTKHRSHSRIHMPGAEKISRDSHESSCVPAVCQRH